MFTSLLIDTVLIFNPVTPGTDRYGNETEVFDGGTAVQGRVWQLDADEWVIDRDTRITTLGLIVPAGTNISALSRVSYDGHMHRVEGEPAKVKDATGQHHVEARLTRIEG